MTGENDSASTLTKVDVIDQWELKGSAGSEKMFPGRDGILHTTDAFIVGMK